MLSQEAKNLDFHVKPPEIFNVGKIIHVLENTVQAKENINSNRLPFANWVKPDEYPPCEVASDLWQSLNPIRPNMPTIL